LPDEARSAELVTQMRNPAFHNLLIAEDEAQSVELVTQMRNPTFYISI
jgi:hypothetical protein